jgi:hypothetical protein
MSVIYTAGTTWLIAASETSHKKQTKLRYLGYAEKCVEYLRETGMVWETGARLEGLLKAVIDEQRGKLDGTLLRSGYSSSASGVTSEPSSSSSSSNKSHVPPSTSMIHENTTNRSLQQEPAVPQVIPLDYFNQNVMGEQSSEQDIISSHFGDEPSPSPSTFAKNNSILFGSIASSFPLPQIHQQESSNVIAPDPIDLFGQDPVNGFDSSMDWCYALFSEANSITDDVDISNMVGYNEQGMPMWGGFPNSSSYFLPTQQQRETEWLRNVLS